MFWLYRVVMGWNDCVMQYVKYGKDGPEVSRLGFGVMRLPARRKGAWGSVNWSRAIPVMRRAMAAGVDFFDTHHEYHEGLSEEAIGRALKGWKGRRIVIQTKTPMYRNLPLREYQRMVEEALRKCGVEQLDYLLSHSLRMGDFKRSGRKFFRLTDWAMKKGYVRRRGFSSHDTPEHVRAFIDTGEFSVMVLSYNWLNPVMAETIAYGAEKGMGVAIMNPVGGGALGETTREIRRMLPGAKTAAEIALRFVLSTPGVTLAMSGMSNFTQVNENARIAGRKTMLTARQRERMSAQMARFTGASKAICTACGYCLPCPHGVDIPGNFVFLTQARVLGLMASSRARFSQLRKRREGDASALACRRCGKCLARCPNEVPIIEQLEETAALLT